MFNLYFKILLDLAKNRIYLRKGQTPPEGVRVNKGTRDPNARWYTPKFKEDVWKGMDANERRKNWKKLSVTDKDRLADPSNSILHHQIQLLSDVIPWKDTRNVERDIHSRIDGASHKLFPESKQMIRDLSDDLLSVLSKSGVDPQTIRPLLVAATDALLTQEMESCNHQLGDHGIHHIKGDIKRGHEILNCVPNEGTPEQVAQLYLTGIFHDIGYLTGPARMTLQTGHSRWSQEYFQTHIAPLMKPAFDSSTINSISMNVGNHDSSDIDWENDPIGSAFRVSDNTALFAEDKLPPVYRYVPENINVLIDIASGKLTFEGGKSVMIQNISSNGNLSPYQKSTFLRAAEESTEFTTNQAIGMLGGKIVGAAWEDEHIVIKIRPDDTYTALQQVSDLGQSQFGAFAESYNYDPKQFIKDLSFDFVNSNGKKVLTGKIV